MDTWRIEEVWEHARGEGITVAVIDGGVDSSRPELAGQVLDGEDFNWGPDGAHFDKTGHGTLMSALIAGTGAGGGIQGLAPEAKILPLRVTDELTFDFGSEARIATAIEYAVEEGAQVISISLAGDELGADREIVDAAIAEAARQDVLIFAGVGNEGDTENRSLFPAAREGIVGVAAVDRNGDHARYSNHGVQVALAAPGDDVPTYCPLLDGDPCLVSEGGTSAATALAAGAAALVRSAHPDWTKNQVLRAMMETADAPEGGRDDYVGHGMIRPDRILLDGTVDPGDPGTNPLFAEYEATLDPPVSPEPQPEPEPSEAEAQEEQPAPSENQAAATGGGDDGIGPWALAGGAGVLLVAGILTAVILNRRRDTTSV
ncbi:S8 family serine peptidase [Streptomyces specialis]|uniref:S8 family serine peptidase n=1 Tax=Streptomyces specialis TaxID=498367 RepID=UPI00073E7A4A|nr:S8 family serine peptidase [Streptomyces specialis]